jgi:CelD/BcsL family acetyltransferase involved in cellulose biosynthesis
MPMSFEEARAFTIETLETITSYYGAPESLLKWDCLFVSPAWLKAWWNTFGGGQTPYLGSITRDGELLGIAPLLRQGQEVRFMGSADVCDYFDFVVVPTKEPEFFRLLIEHLQEQGVTRLDLGPVRNDSTVLKHLCPVAGNLGCEVSLDGEEVSLELDLPATWEEFMLHLTAKERHEIRRKLRRLDTAANFRVRVVEGLPEVQGAMDSFLALFRLSRPEKATFLSAQRAGFFCSLAEAMAELKALQLFFLDLDGTPAAAALCFDYNSTVYLYNSGYDPRFRRLSVGLLDKVFSIRESLERGRKKYDFLKGAEAYKYRLGGRPIPLYRCQITLQ